MNLQHMNQNKFSFNIVIVLVVLCGYEWVSILGGCYSHYDCGLNMEMANNAVITQKQKTKI